MKNPAAPNDDWIPAFLADEKLPVGFLGLISALYAPLATEISAKARSANGLFVVGLCGPQGSGKSTGAAVLSRLIERQGLRVATLSLDDLYLTRTDRARLAESVHPLLATRGPPGTHDVGLGLDILTDLRASAGTLLPRFDKALDDRRPTGEWQVVAGKLDVLLFEGWFVGAMAEPECALDVPINELERREDREGIWRRYVNAALAGRYAVLFRHIDALILLRAPDFSAVVEWRTEQEAKLRAKTPATGAGRVMTDTEIRRFVQFFERTTRQIDREMPSRADLTVELNAQQRPVSFRGSLTGITYQPCADIS